VSVWFRLKKILDTETATGKLMVTVIAAINEFERENLLERQLEGIKIAKRLGKYKGRKKIEKPGNFDETADKYLKKEITAIEAMKRLDLKKNAFYNFLKSYKTYKSCGGRPGAGVSVSCALEKYAV
jgi:DNA invertase Pin-like site-specific DNA recombinase